MDGSWGTNSLEFLSQSGLAARSLALFQTCLSTPRDKLDVTAVMPLLMFCYFDPVIIHLR